MMVILPEAKANKAPVCVSRLGADLFVSKSGPFSDALCNKFCLLYIVLGFIYLFIVFFILVYIFLQCSIPIITNLNINKLMGLGIV